MSRMSTCITVHLRVATVAGLVLLIQAGALAVPPSSGQNAPPVIDLSETFTLLNDPITGQALAGLDKTVSIEHNGREIRLASQANAERFLANPQQYLPGIDQQLIAQQLPYYPLQTCIVSGEPMGGQMGQPVDYLHGNRLVRFCCKGCLKQFKKNPAEYLARLNAAVAKAQAPIYPMTTCPVSRSRLGSMGPAVQAVAGNRLVQFCCGGCVGALKKNPAAIWTALDQAVITSQKPNYRADSCPVSGKKLSDMGKPVNIVYGGRLVRLCCSGCVRKFYQDPARYLAGLAAQTSAPSGRKTPQPAAHHQSQHHH